MTSVDERFNQAMRRAMGESGLMVNSDGLEIAQVNAADRMTQQIVVDVLEAVHLRDYIEVTSVMTVEKLDIVIQWFDLVDEVTEAARNLLSLETPPLGSEVQNDLLKMRDILARIDAHNEAT